MKTHFHLMISDPKDSQVKFEKVICAALGEPLEKHLRVIPRRGTHLTLDEPNLKKYLVWNTHLKLLKDEELLEIELLDPEETSVYPKLRH